MHFEGIIDFRSIFVGKRTTINKSLGNYIFLCFGVLEVISDLISIIWGKINPYKYVKGVWFLNWK